MKISNNKTKATMIALFLTLTIAVTLVISPTAKAHTPPVDVPTWCYIGVSNRVLGVSQQQLIVFWINSQPPTGSGNYGDRWTFTVEVTKPDGSKDTLGPFISDPVGGFYALYTPTAVGTYSAVAKFAQHKIDFTPNGQPPDWSPFSFGFSSVGDTYLASQSDPASFTVQQQAVQSWQEPPLPTNSYWTLPVNSANRGWASIVGNWLGLEAQNVGPTIRFAYGTGPESAHVLWATPMWSGGIMDARFGDTGYKTGDYEGLGLAPPIILDGKIYYNVQSLPREGWICLDLYTGQTLYFHNTTGPVTGVSDGGSGSIAGEALSMGQIYNYESPNQHGGIPYLWSTGPAPSPFGPPGPPATWKMFDAFTGNYMLSISNVPSFVQWGSSFIFGADRSVYGKDGSILSYNIAALGSPVAPQYYLQCWNSSKAIWYHPVFASNNYWLWRPGLNVTYDGNNGYSLNASIPAVQGGILAVREDQYVIGGTSGKNNGTYVQLGNLWALNLKAAADGTITPTLLWNITYTPPKTSVPDVAGASIFGGGPVAGPIVDPEDGVFVFNQAITRQWWVYNLATGQPLWGPSSAEESFNYYGMMDVIYQGKLFTYGYGGELIAYDIKTGTILWTYNATQVGFESPYGGNYPLFMDCVSDGKLYMYSSEHSPTQPLWRGSYERCINASNGAELWKLLLWEAGPPPALGGNVGAGAIADGYLVTLNFYDNRIYCIGKGPTATTVTAPDTAVPLGSGVMIRGTVTDQSPGAKGAACVADADQEAWMEYLYMQQAIPTHAAGVQVTLTAADPNHNTQVIGTATTDMGGSYGIMWTPPVPGTYTIMATFAGSKSYGSSFATTYLGVGPASPSAQPTSQPTSPPAQTPTSTVSPSVSPPVSPSTAPTPASPPSNTAPTMTLYIVLAAVVIIIVIAAAAIVLRRRK